jgi:LmbE family N-acetylglucosaminyl deacetylase
MLGFDNHETKEGVPVPTNHAMLQNLSNATTTKVASLGPILGIWAHPDDEAWLSAGLMALAIEHGLSVDCVTATGGEAGSQDQARWPEETIAATRQNELLKSLKIIGIDKEAHRFLGFVDGQCRLEDNQKAIQAILAHMIRVTPATVVTFGPDGFTGHSDHQKVSDWTTKAFLLYQARYAPHARLLYQASTSQWQHDCRPLLKRANALYGDQYPTITPDKKLFLNLTLSGPLLELKLEAVRAHVSQLTPLVAAVGGFDPLLAWFAHESFILAIPPSLSTSSNAPARPAPSRPSHPEGR